MSFRDSVSGQKLQLAVKYLFTHRLSAFILLLKESQVTKSCLESPYCALQLAPKKLHWVSDLGGQATMFSELLQLKHCHGISQALNVLFDCKAPV